MDSFLFEGRYGFLGPRAEADDAILARQGWRVARATCTTTLWVRGQVLVREVPGGWIIGELFERGSGKAASAAPLGDPDAREKLEMVCTRLLRGFWGRYVALFPEHKAILRDPSGHLECLTWQTAAAWMAGSDLPADLPADLLPKDLAVDWSVIAGMLGDEGELAADLALRGVSEVRPGALSTFSGETSERLLWEPATYALQPHADYAASRRAVVDAVEESLAAEVAGGDRLVAEISGGVDSAIVAGTLVKLGAADRTHFIHFHVDEPGADERAFARAVAAMGGVGLMEVVKPELRIDATVLTTMPIGARPSNSAMDRHYDASLADLAKRAGARKILTGQGGDMVFYQTPSRKLVSELIGPWARHPRPDPLWRQLEAAARWNRCSVWSLLGEAARDALAAPNTAAIDHPWLARRVPPAKARQLTSLIRSQAFLHGASLRERAAHLVHPLLNQPVLEAVLASPVVDLARGGRGRSLAREAFSDRIPAAVRWRRSKGELTAYYGRMVQRSVAALRPFLLEGRLVGERVLDAEAVEGFLDPDRMIHEGNYPGLFRIIALEAFVRHWDGRAGAVLAEDGGAFRRSASQGSTSA
jgi:asparagine synthase (glutamine-hydrolysing)